MNYEQTFNELAKNLNDSKLNALFNLLNSMLDFFFKTSDDTLLQEKIKKCLKMKSRFSKEKRVILLKYLDYIQDQIFEKNLKDFEHQENTVEDYYEDYDGYGYEDECFEFMY